MLRILVVDDHALMRSGIRRILEEALTPVAIGEAGNAEEALASVRAQPWDVVLLDISLPGKSGLEVLTELKALKPTLPVLMLSMHAEEQFAIRCLRSGANGYLTKETAPNELLVAIRRLLEGRRYVSEALAERLAEEATRGQMRLPHETLSPREFEVLRGLASGRTLTDLANDLELSIKTVSTYRSRVLEKLSVKTNAELVQYALRYGLIS